MLFAIALTVGFILFVWLIFFQFKWLKWSIAWAIVAFIILLHVLLIFMIGLRFVTPYSTQAIVIQHTIQLIPRLTEPTLVTAVLVEPNVPVKKGQPLLQFDRRPYEDKVRQLEAQLAQAKQNIRMLQADVQVAEQTLARKRDQVEYSKFQVKVYQELARTGAGREENAVTWEKQLQVDEDAVAEAAADLDRAKLKYEIGGMTTSVAGTEAELDLARSKGVAHNALGLAQVVFGEGTYICHRQPIELPASSRSRGDVVPSGAERYFR